jgi:hypothetical protein
MPEIQVWHMNCVHSPSGLYQCSLPATCTRLHHSNPGQWIYHQAGVCFFLRVFHRAGVSLMHRPANEVFANHRWKTKLPMTAKSVAAKNMNAEDIQLQKLLRESRATPTLPPRFQENVWRRIEDAEFPARPATWLDSLAALILQPRFALAVATALVLIGVFAGVQEGRQTAQHDAQMNYLASVAPHSLR